jgi:hypothetical protein
LRLTIVRGMAEHVAVVPLGKGGGGNGKRSMRAGRGVHLV